MPSEPLTPAELAVYPEPQDVEYPISPHDFFTQLLLTHFWLLAQSLSEVQYPGIVEHVTHAPSEPLTPVELAVYPEPHDVL